METMIIDGWRVDLPGRRAQRKSEVQHLSPRAIRLLIVLAEAQGSVVSRDTLLDRVWPELTVSDESLTQVISELRKKMQNRQLIATVVRGGYRLTVPVLSLDGNGPMRSQFDNASTSFDSYTLCIEALDLFERGRAGYIRSFAELTGHAASQSPNFVLARELHAVALLKRHLFWSEGEDLIEKAMEESEAAICLDPNSAYGYFVDGVVKLTSGEFENGSRSIGRALALAPNDLALHNDAAIFLQTHGQFKSSGLLATKAAKLAPQDFGPKMLLARLHQREDIPRAKVWAEKAITNIKTELAFEPDSLRALYGLGPMLAQIGDKKAALRQLESTPISESPLEIYRAFGFAQIGDASSTIEVIEFLAANGWRHISILGTDPSFYLLRQDNRFNVLVNELSTSTVG